MMAGILALLGGSGPQANAEVGTRAIPRPLPSHPGNIFLAGEQVSVAAPPGSPESWRAIDYEGKSVAEGRLEKGRAELGKLPVGYYELVWGDRAASNRVSLGEPEYKALPTRLEGHLCFLQGIGPPLARAGRGVRAVE